jgi:hypothetical protein
MQDDGRMNTRNWIIGAVVVVVLAVVIVWAMRGRGTQETEQLPEELVQTAPAAALEPSAELAASRADERPESPADAARR